LRKHWNGWKKQQKT